MKIVCIKCDYKCVFISTTPNDIRWFIPFPLAVVSILCDFLFLLCVIHFAVSESFFWGFLSFDMENKCLMHTQCIVNGEYDPVKCVWLSNIC